MAIKTWIFERCQGRDYAWTTAKPGFAPEMIAWLESLSFALTSRPNKTQKQPILFAFEYHGKYYYGVASLPKKTDEYGREIADVTVSFDDSPTIGLKFNMAEDLLLRIQETRFREEDYDVILEVEENLKKTRSTYYFGPKSHIEGPVQFEFRITENEMQLRPAINRSNLPEIRPNFGESPTGTFTSSIESIKATRREAGTEAQAVSFPNQRKSVRPTGGFISRILGISVSSPVEYDTSQKAVDTIFSVRRLQKSDNLGEVAEILYADGRKFNLSAEHLQRVLELVKQLESEVKRGAT